VKNLIILDRDGVINYDPGYIDCPQKWHALPGSLEAIAQLNQAGYTVVVVSNQSGIGRGKFSHEDLARIHQKMTANLLAVGGHIDQIFYCPHLPTDHCLCRKPQIGLFQQISQHYGQSLQGTPCIGDKLTDLQAAVSIGGKPILVRTGCGEDTLKTLAKPHYAALCKSIMIADSLEAVVKNSLMSSYHQDGRSMPGIDQSNHSK